MKTKVDKKIKLDKIAEIFANEKRLTEILQYAISEAVQMHRRAGNPIAVWKNGKAVWVKAE